MKKLLRIVFAMGLVLSMTVSAHANVDQRCVSDCVTGSNAASSCVQACTYGSSTVKSHAQSAPGTDTGANHKLLDAPVPSSALVLQTETAKKKAVSKDYDCINQCLKDGWQYPLCEGRCQKTNCGPGITRCKDLTGITLAPVPVSPPAPSPIAAPFSK